MREKYEKDLFEMIMKEKGVYLFDNICLLIKDTIKDVKEQMADEEHSAISEVLCLENNANWELKERHSQRIQKMWDRQHLLVSKYLVDDND